MVPSVMKYHFPFGAIVGQDMLKRALLLGVIQPGLGGVLIRGTKGLAKSTAVRALTGLLPPIETVAGCPFRRRPGEVVADWPLPPDASIVTNPVPLVELPLGATEDRVLGTLHLEKALRGERAFEPGLLAAANRGLLYIDEVNLLADHLVDVLLDVAAGGVHRVEREGLSLSHPARFLLVGTMNPEEGELRPQLLDRFGLAVDVVDLADPAQRVEAVRRRLAFEADPAGFVQAWRDADVAEAERIVRARQLLPAVGMSEAIVRAASERCLAARVEGLRADLTLCKAAAAWAAYQGRREVEIADLEAVAELALVHRRTPPTEPPETRKPEGGRRNGEPKSSAAPPSAGGGSRAEMVLPSAGLFAARCRPPLLLLAESSWAGRWRHGTASPTGPRHGSPRCCEPGAAVAWAETLRAASGHQAFRGRTAADPRFRLEAADLRHWPPRGPAGCLLLFVIDASGSMAAWQRMRQTKAAVLALLVQAYRRRDRVALLAFRNHGVEPVLPPTRGLGAARQALERLPVGGTTPLAHGLAAARQLIRGQRRRQPRQPIWTVLLSDGRANVPQGSTDPWHDALSAARALAACDTECLVVDTETGWPRFGRARQLAHEMAAKCLGLEEILGRSIPA